MLSAEQLRRFGSDGFLVARNVVAEALVSELAAEADSRTVVTCGKRTS